MFTSNVKLNYQQHIRLFKEPPYAVDNVLRLTNLYWLKFNLRCIFSTGFSFKVTFRGKAEHFSS
jgi:hypothetical protein